MIKVRRKIQFATRDRGRQVLTDAPLRAMEAPGGRVPRVSRLMALAIHFERLIREGTAKDITELARLTHVTQPRMTQIMNLNLLAPDIQEELLDLRPAERGRDAVHEKTMRTVVACPAWSEQRRLWRAIRDHHSADSADCSSATS